MSARPDLSLFAFHLAWQGSTPEEEDAATRELLDGVATRGRVLLTGCTIDEGNATRFLARVCVLSFRTRQTTIDACVEDILEETRALLAART